MERAGIAEFNRRFQKKPIYAISLPFTSPLSSLEPIDVIPMDELRTKSRRKAITDSYSTGGCGRN